MTDGIATTPGGIAASMRTGGDGAHRVAPTSRDGCNTIRPAMYPIACWRIDSHRFHFGSSFVLPNATNEFALLGRLRPPSPPDAGGAGPKLAVFGHTDRTGTDAANKTLSGRRAKAVHALLTRDVDAWDALYASPAGSDQWGARAIRVMLAIVGHPNGRFGDEMTAEARDALRRFQRDAGLAPSGEADAPTRKALHKAYMDAICVDDAGAPLVYGADSFLGKGADPGGKGAYQGCSAFNPVVVPSRDRMRVLDEAANHPRRDAALAANRRVVVYVFPETIDFPIDKWPCPRADEGVDGCRKQFWKQRGDERRQPSDATREHARGERTFSCRLYDGFARFSPCEVARKSMRVWLLDAFRRRMPGAPFRATVDRQTVDGVADGEGCALVPDVFPTSVCTLEWGAATSANPDERVYRYATRLDLRFDDDAPEDRADAEALARLHNLGYAPTLSFEEAIARFQLDYGIARAAWPDASTKRALWDAHVSGKESGASDSIPDAGVEPDFDPILPDGEEVHDWASRRRDHDDAGFLVEAQEVDGE